MADASGTKKSGDSVLTSEDVDHQQTTNRTHDGDTITPEALEATDIIGNAVYQSKSDIPSEYEQKGNMAYTEADGLVVFKQ